MKIWLFDNQFIKEKIKSIRSMKLKGSKDNYAIILLFIFGSLFSFACQSGNSEATDQISKDILAKDAYQMIQTNQASEDLIILDTRTAGEYKRGHIQNSFFIDYSSSSFKAEIEKLDRNKKYVIYCHSGGRSKTTLNMMKNLGFKEAHNMIGGIVAWSKSGYQLVQ